MRIFFYLALFPVIFLSLSTETRCYDVSVSKDYIKIELQKWSNFTVHVETRGYVYTNKLIMEVNHTNDTRVSPKIVEIHMKNFSSWCQMYNVYASKPGSSRIDIHFGNSSNGEKEVHELHIDIDIVKIKALEFYETWCRKLHYIFSIISVYPQLCMQYLRLSVVGLDMDYVCFNFIGHLSHSIYTIFMYTQADVYSESNSDEDFPMTLSENMYALHGLIFAAILGIQAIKYYGVDKRVTVVGKELISFYGIVFTFGFLLAKFHIIRYLDFLYVCKFIFIGSTSTKYIPQLYKNYVIKSTFGWNIWNSNLESVGCVMIIISLLMTAYNYDNWMGMVTNHLFWMALVILLQHVGFMIQHYLIYQKWSEFDVNEFQEITLQEKIALYEQRLEHN